MTFATLVLALPGVQDTSLAPIVKLLFVILILGFFVWLAYRAPIAEIFKTIIAFVCALIALWLVLKAFGLF